MKVATRFEGCNCIAGTSRKTLNWLITSAPKGTMYGVTPLLCNQFMETRIVNCRKELFDVYIGRSGHGLDGYFGNPHPIGYCFICHVVHDRDAAIAMYQLDAERRVKTDPEFRQRVKGLYGQTLGCFCAPLDCHGRVLADISERLNTEK